MKMGGGKWWLMQLSELLVYELQTLQKVFNVMMNGHKSGPHQHHL